MPGWSEVEVVQRVRARRTVDAAWSAGHAITPIDDAREPSSGLGPLTRAARRAWVERLAGGDTALRATLEWGLVGPDDAFTAGAALNSALLYGAGRRLIAVDEDVHPEVVGPPGGEPGPRGDPTALEVLRPEGGEPEGGRPFGELLSTLPETLTAPVASVGLVGDGGMRSSVVYLLRGGAWLAAQADRWPEVAASRVVHRAAPTPTRGAHLMSSALLLDLRGAAPPPLLPVLRNTDGLWGRWLAAEGQATLHLSAAIRHALKPSVGSRSAAVQDLVRPRASDLLSLAEPRSWPSDEKDGSGEWQAALLGPWRAHCERIAERLDDARRLAPVSALALREDIEASIRILVAHSGRVPPPADLDVDDPWAALTQLVSRYQDLVNTWSDAWSRAHAAPFEST